MRVQGMVLDLDEGSLRFFKNGQEHIAGFGPGIITGPVFLYAVRMPLQPMVSVGLLTGEECSKETRNPPPAKWQL